MKKPDLHDQEDLRVAALKEYGILDTPDDPVFDGIVKLAAQICNAPYAMINLIVDQRQWFKAVYGLPGVKETPRPLGICSHTILANKWMEVEDTALDPRFCDNPLVVDGPKFRYYAGSPLFSATGLPVGTLCVLDDKPRTLASWQREALEELARVVVVLFEKHQLEIAGRTATDVLESITDAFLAFDNDWRFSYMNAEAEKLLGRRREALQGKNVWEEYPEAVNSTFYTEYHRAKAENTPVHFEEFFQPLNGWFQVRAFPRPDGLSVYFQEVTAQKTTEAALRESEERFRLVIDNALDAFISIDEDDRILQWSRQATDLFGWSAGEVQGRLLNETIIPPQYREAHARGMAHYKRTGHGPVLGQRIQITALRRDGTEIPVELAITPFQTSLGCTVFSASLRDISERKAAEEALQASEESFRATFEQAASGVAHVALDGSWLRFNRKLLDILGYPPDELRTLSFRDITHPDDLADNLVNVQRLLTGEMDTYATEKRYLHKNGSLIWADVTVSLLRNTAGEAQYFIVIIEDVSQRKAAELALRESEERFRTTFEQVALGMAHVSPERRLLRVNPKMCEIFGYTEDELLHLDMQSLSHPDDVDMATPFIPRLLSGEIDAANFEKRYLRKNGDVLWARITGRVVRDTEGMVKYFVMSLEDITPRKLADQAVRQAEADFRLLMESVTDYGIIVLDPGGVVESWNSGAETIFGYGEQEVVGKELSFTFTEEDKQRGEPERERRQAREEGRSIDDRWHQRKDGSRFFATGMVFPLWHTDGTLRGYVKVTRDNTQRREAEERMAYLANHDSLTGLPNRSYLSTRLHEEMARARREGVYLAFMLLDLDRFKSVNDTLGHQLGDLLLKEVAARLLGLVRETDVIARLGGDEFVVLQTGLARPEDAKVLGQKIVEGLARPYFLDGNEVHSGTSIGIALYSPQTVESVDLMMQADRALYRAKELGRDNYQLYSEALHSAVVSKARLEEGLRHALANGEFSLVFQPIIDLGSWKIGGVEALLRWQNSDQHILSPKEFLSLADETGEIVPVGEWVLRQVCRQGVLWRAKGLPPFRMAVNISARQLKDSRFSDMIQNVLQETGFDPGCLDLELTESLLMTEAHEAILKSLRVQGVNISIDDFGTGQVPLSYIRSTSIDAIKIDRVFIDQVAHNRRDNAIAGAAIGLARGLGIRVIAEGVETTEQLAFLKSQGCTSAQGFLFSEPVGADALEELLRSGNWSRMNPE